MCGRYYIDSDMADEIEKVVNDIDQRIRQEHFSGDIRPTNAAPVIEKSEHGMKLDICRWGYPPVTGKESGHQCKSGISYGQTCFSEWNSISPYFNSRKRIL